VYIPAKGDAVGVATAPLIVYVADATLELMKSAFTAIALIVVVDETVRADE
jgi:hypothetical protein